MAEVQRNVRIKLVPRRNVPTYPLDGTSKLESLKPIYFPAIITTDTTTGKFRVSVNIAGDDAQQADYRVIANMTGDLIAGGFDGQVKVTQEMLGFGLGDDGAEYLIKHLEATDNLGQLAIYTNERLRKEYVMTGLHYGDPTQGLLLAKKLSADIFNKEATVAARQNLVKEQGDESYATTPTPEEVAAENQKTGETQQPASEDGNVDGGGTDEPPQRQWDGQFDTSPTAGFVPKFTGGKDLGKGTLSYPEDLETTQQDYLKIRCFVYAPQTLELGRVSSPSGAAASGEQQGPTVYLPITGASDTSTVGWGEQSANPLQIGLYQAAASFIGAELRDLGNVFSDLGAAAQGLVAQNEMMRPAIKSYFASQAAGVTGMLSRTTGAVFNPNIVLLFNSPELRKFSFTFRMSARSDTEAVIIRRIIRYFRQYSRPGISGKQLFLTTPNVFTIEYKVPGNNGLHKSIGQPKGACALTSVGVNYVPDGSYMTFNDEARTMTSYELTLNFSELEPIYQSDYNLEADHIGY